MYAFRPSSRWLAMTSARATRGNIRDAFAAKVQEYDVPTIPTCPAPTCECAEMPADLDIERTKNLNGTIAAYAEHVIVTTGQADWRSKIEDEKDTAPWGLLTARLKALLGPKGQFFDAYRNTIVSASSFSPAEDSAATSRPQVMLFPSFQMIDDVSTSEEDITSLIRSFLLPESSQKSSDDTTQEQAGSKEVSSEWNGRVRSIDVPTILICSHHSRDSRCGVLGPLLHAEFEQFINKQQTLRNAGTPDTSSTDKNLNVSFASHPTFRPEATDGKEGRGHPINIGMISHIGGHKWAGNVIVYIPPGYETRPLKRVQSGRKPQDEQKGSEPVVAEDEILTPEIENQNVSPLAGKGIWYGRVEPKHVEGIVEMTIGHGQIIRELFRGGIHQDGTPIRL